MFKKSLRKRRRRRRRKKKKKKKKNNNNNSKPQQKTNHRLQQVADYQPGDCLKEGTNIHPCVSPAEGVNRSEAPYINKDGSPLSVLMLFLTKIFHLLVEQTNVYYQQHFRWTSQT